ncbi:CUX2 (predicted) [Pycnogonum litorale]
MAATNVQMIVQYWKKFDLTGLQKQLDETTEEIALRRDNSSHSRTKLIQLCREFKKVASEEVKTAVAPLLKSFQSEIDALSKRSKAAEIAFLAIYKQLAELPGAKLFELRLQARRSDI